MQQCNLSNAFISSLVEECYNAGLTKEATAVILQQASIDKACSDSPDFAEGYYGESLELEKEAGFWSQLPKAVGKFVGRGTEATMRGAGAAARTVASPAFLKGTARAGLYGSALYGGKVVYDKFTENSSNPDPYTGFAGYGDGSFDANKARQEYNTRLERASGAIPGISRDAQLTSTPRYKELQQAVAQGLPGSDKALMQMKDMEGKAWNANKVVSRETYNLNNAAAANNNAAAKWKSEAQDALATKDRPFWRSPTKWWYDAQHKWNPDRYASPDMRLTQEAAAAQGRAAQYTTDANIQQQVAQRAREGYVGSPPPLTQPAALPTESKLPSY